MESDRQNQKMNPKAQLSNYIHDGSLPSEDSDLTLIGHIAAKDEKSLEELYRRYRVLLFNYVLRLTHDPHAAEDILQEVFLGVWQGAGRFQGRSMVKTWLFRITHLQTAFWLRKQSKVAYHSDDLLENVEDQESPTPESIAFQLWDWNLVHRALEQLSPVHREVIELSFAQGFSNPEIANILACPTGTVKSRLHYALLQLNRILSR